LNTAMSLAVSFRGPLHRRRDPAALPWLRPLTGDEIEAELLGAGHQRAGICGPNVLSHCSPPPWMPPGVQPTPACSIGTHVIW